MYGDPPPAILAIDASLFRQPEAGPRLAREVERLLARRPAWIVTDAPDSLEQALQRLGIRLPRLDGPVAGERRSAALVAGDVMAAFDVAQRLHSREVRVWCGEGTAPEDLSMPVLIRAHDDGVHLTVEAPLAAHGAA